jgi:hypothetical protein
MICENTRYIELADFDCIGDVAVHCDLRKLCIAITEAQNFDLYKLFCGKWSEIEDIIKEVDDYQKCTENCVEPENYDKKKALICGGDYECGNGTMYHLGIKKILVYYAYSRYLLINGFNDTPNGAVSKSNSFSIPKPLGEIKMFSQNYRDMGFEAFKRTAGFLCVNSDIFTFVSGCSEVCRCGAECNGVKTVVGKIRFKTLRKDGV